MGALQDASQPKPERTRGLHGSLLGQLVGQAPGRRAAIPMSQVSPVSTVPLPHTIGQSLSTARVAPGGQQPSLSSCATIG